MRDFVTSRVAAQNLRAIGTETPSVSGDEIMSIIRPRIVGGAPALATESPFQVALLMASQPNNAQAQFCGGTLVRPNMVVTAAHCSDFVTAGQVQVLTGTRRLDGTGNRRDVARIAIHPAWNSGTFDKRCRGLGELPRSGLSGQPIESSQSSSGSGRPSTTCGLPRGAFEGSRAR